jgi:hypothetical protein
MRAAPPAFKAMRIKCRGPHDPSLRADRGAPPPMDWSSFKAAQQGSARRQVSPNQLIRLGNGGIQTLRHAQCAACQGNPSSHRHAAHVAKRLNAMTVATFDQHCLEDIPHAAARLNR